MKYPERWRLALALKQPYPVPGETGAEGDATAAPPVFQVAATDEKTQTRVNMVGAGGLALGFVAGIALAYWAVESNRKSGR
jgi:hypothetical protein